MSLLFWKRVDHSVPIGLLAGQGEFPLLFAKAAASMGQKIILFGAEGYTDKRVEDFVSEVHYVNLGSLGTLIDLLKRAKIKQVVLAGGIPKREMVNPSFKVDGTLQGFISGNRNKGDDHLLRAFEVFLKLKCGISVLDSRLFLKGLLASKGVMTQRAPTDDEQESLRFGWRVAKGIGKLDIGQTVVVKGWMILAVESVEGTDQAIRRGGQLSHGGAVVVKVSKPNQDLRFDLPCVGQETLASMKAVSSVVLGVEADKTMMLSKDELIQAADRDGISIVGL